MVTVSQAINNRRSIRGYLDKPIDAALLTSLLERASRAPSGGNVQPWRVTVLTGAKLTAFKQVMAEKFAKNPLDETADYDVYPNPLPEIYNARRVAVGAGMYEKLGIAQDDKATRHAMLGRNFQFFDAPVGLIFSIDKIFDKNGWAHMGMYMQTLALLAVEEGLGSCMQEAWAFHAKTAADFIGLSEDTSFWAGMALGYPDMSLPVNDFVTTRAPLEEFVTFLE